MENQVYLKSNRINVTDNPPKWDRLKAVNMPAAARGQGFKIKGLIECACLSSTGTLQQGVWLRPCWSWPCSSGVGATV